MVFCVMLFGGRSACVLFLVCWKC